MPCLRLSARVGVVSEGEEEIAIQWIQWWRNPTTRHITNKHFRHPGRRQCFLHRLCNVIRVSVPTLLVNTRDAVVEGCLAIMGHRPHDVAEVSGPFEGVLDVEALVLRAA